MTDTLMDGLDGHRRAVRDFTRRLVGNDAQAEDLTQETFLRVERSESAFRGQAKERSWLIAIALNLVRDHFRATKRLPDTTTDTEVVEGIAGEGADAETEVLEKEMSSCIGEYLLRLPRPQCQAVALHDLAELTHREIAAQLDISEANARVLLHRGRTAFRKILEDNCVLSLGSDDIPCERLPPEGEGG